MANTGVLSVARMDGIVIWQGKEVVLNTVDQILVIASREVSSSDGSFKEGISREDELVVWKDKGNAADGMARCWDNSKAKAI